LHSLGRIEDASRLEDHMKRSLLFGTFFSAALAAGVAAQGGSTATPTGQPGSRAQDQQNQITVTGCLQNAEMAGGGAAGTSGTATGGSGSTSGTTASGSQSRGGAQFMLTNATMARTSGSGTSASGTSGSGTTGTGTSGSTAGSAASGTAGAGSMNRYLLIGGNQQNLKQYLNSQVEVQGRLDQSKGAMSSGASSTGTSSTGSGSGSTGSGSTSGSSAAGQETSRMTDAQRLQVTSVRQIASTCTGR
jgi:hypothetical protein